MYTLYMKYRICKNAYKQIYDVLKKIELPFPTKILRTALMAIFTEIKEIVKKNNGLT